MSSYFIEVFCKEAGVKPTKDVQSLSVDGLDLSVAPVWTANDYLAGGKLTLAPSDDFFKRAEDYGVGIVEMPPIGGGASKDGTVEASAPAQEVQIHVYDMDKGPVIKSAIEGLGYETFA